jgi:hypothetical protein
MLNLSEFNGCGTFFVIVVTTHCPCRILDVVNPLEDEPP